MRRGIGRSEAAPSLGVPTRVFARPRLRLRLRVLIFVLPLLELRLMPRSPASSLFAEAEEEREEEVEEKLGGFISLGVPGRLVNLPERGRRLIVLEAPCEDTDRSSSSAARVESWYSLQQ
jgi:hypothetical protein